MNKENEWFNKGRKENDKIWEQRKNKEQYDAGTKFHRQIHERNGNKSSNSIVT